MFDSLPVFLYVLDKQILTVLPTSMALARKEIFDKVNDLVTTNGIPSYLEKWKKVKPNFDVLDAASKTDTQFLRQMKNYIKLYHKHSNVYVEKQRDIQRIRDPDTSKDMKTPNLS